MLLPRLNIKINLSKVLKAFLGSSKIGKPIPNLSYLNHARTAIVLILESLNMPKGSKVGIVAYNCHTVMNAIDTLGYEVVFIDITDHLLMDIDDLRRKSADISVLIISHLFGITNDVDKIKKMLHDVIIIEDCAHSCKSLLPSGDFAGSAGDFAIFSVGLGKFPSIGNGGILKVNNTAYSERVESLIKQMPKCNMFDNIKDVITQIAWKILYQPFVYDRITLPLKRRKPSTTSIRKKIVAKRMSKITKAILFLELPNLPYYVELQKRNAAVWIKWLQKQNAALTPLVQDTSNYFMLPILCADKANLIFMLKQKGIEAATHFEQSLYWAKEFGYNQGACPNYEKLLKKVIMLPCHYNLAEKQLQKILYNK
jgi:dTDP-4-amino-4,6-dideoxygalactose transaminase